MAKELLNTPITVGDQQLTVGELVKMLKTSRRAEIRGNKFVITNRVNKQIEINIKELSSEQALALFSNGFEKVEGLFGAYVKGLDKSDASSFYGNLTSVSSNSSRITSYVTPETVSAYLASLSGNNKETLKKLTPAQAGLVLRESFNGQVEAAKNNSVATTNPLSTWRELSDAAKYNPETFREIMLDAGTPLFANSRKYRKLVNKDKLVAAMSTASLSEISNIINTFGTRSIFSDELTVGKIIDGIKAEGIKTGQMQDAITKIKEISKLVGEYKKEAVAIGDFSVMPRVLDKNEYEAFLTGAKKDVKLGKNELSASEKDSIREVILGIDTSLLSNSFSTGKQDLEKILQERLGKTNVSRLFSDRAFVRELMTSTLSARALKEFYYGKWDKESKTTEMLSVEKIQAKMNKLGVFMYSLMKDNLKVLDPLKPLDAASAMEELAKKHPGIEAEFSENAKLSKKKKEKFLKKVAKGKFDGKKGKAKFDKFVKKNLAKITADKEFVSDIFSTIEEKAYSEVLNESIDSKKKKGKKLQTKSHAEVVLDNNKALFDSLNTTYDTALVKADELVAATDTLKQTLMSSETYKEQVLRSEKVKRTEEKTQDEEIVLEKK